VASRPDPKELRGLSLCAGYAGLDLGLHIAESNYRTVCYVEREAHAAATLVARMGDKALAPAPIWDDLKSFDGSPWRGRVHIVTAGYPCQPFSCSGLRQGKDDPRHLWPDVARIVRECEPEWVFAENVEGHIDLGFAAVRDELEAMGYSTKAGLFSAAEVGASHRRNRLFILAHTNRERQWESGRHSHRKWAAPDRKSSRFEQREYGAISASKCSAIMGDSLASITGLGLQARGSHGVFAAGPSEFQYWGELLSHKSEAQPALLRKNDGMARHVDQTRGVGNGVCSMAAALAWTILKADFDAEDP
jgi:DNA (cytosine-5)-methyltransferase 1